MRIIAGTYKGKKFFAPRKLPVRPTSDMHKEALFNILYHRFDFENISVLDLFSGTGNIAYEFASRGVPSVECVDKHHACCRFIRETAQALSFPILTHHTGALAFLERTPDTYDIIFADPPYDYPAEAYRSLCEMVFERNLLRRDGVLVIEHNGTNDMSYCPELIENRRYGGTVFSFFGKT